MFKNFLIVSIIVSLSLVYGFTLFGSGEVLRLAVPITDMEGKVGVCRVEILDPDDNIVGSAYHFTRVKKQYYSVPFKIRLKKDVEDYDLLRARVKFKGQERIYSLYQLVDKMVVKILGQNQFIKGTPIKYRAVILNQRTNEPIEDARVHIVLTANDREKRVFEGTTDRLGTCDIEFDAPQDVDNADVHFEIVSDIGKDTYDTSIKLISGNLTYLVTDKPIYQPGQTVHIRTLSLQKPALRAVEGREVTIEIDDSKGNKVFKKIMKTDEFGTTYTPFLLADEVNFGNYTVRALLQGEKTEKTVKVEKYVLPKFKILLETEREYYLPGEIVNGDIDVQYFFGKPLADGRVKITTYRFDIGFQKESVIEGITDKDGHYHFTYGVPEYFVGEPLEKGDAFMRFDIEVTDKANHSEKISVKKKIVQDVIGLTIVPEGGMLRPHLENRIYVLAQYPDGTPCVARLEVEIDGTKMTDKTDDYGIAEFLYTPNDAEAKIVVNAKDEKGETAKIEKKFALDIDRDQVIMRMARGIYAVGESVELQFLTTKKQGRVYLDIVKDNQTILTKAITIHDGKGTYTLNLTPALTGSIWFHAYIVTPGSDIVRDTRFCYIHGADDLAITVKGDRDEYLPGAEGDILFTVTDKNGRPRVAALCIAIVDEAVFAVSELQPGLEKVYFTLEKEILRPRYEIHGFEPQKIVREPGIEPRAENVMFSTLEPKEPFPVNYTTPQDVYEKILQTFYNKLVETRDKIYSAINQYYTRHREYPKSEDGIRTLLDENLLREKDLTDPWARRYRITVSGEYLQWFNIISAGPDGIFENEDDITEWSWRRAKGAQEGILMMEGDHMAVPKVAGAPIPVTETTKRGATPGEEPRIREFFPETFIFEPLLITDVNGRARLAVTMPDAITTWRVTTFASSREGELGSALSQIKVFQDFFVDIDLPVALTEGDEISIPVAIYNYLPRPQEIRLVIEEEEWFDILEKKEIVKQLDKDEVSVVYFPIKVKKIGYHSMLVKAYGEVKSDAIRRRIAVLPDGKRFEDVVADRLEGTVSQKISFAPNAIQDANSLILRIFPGIFSQVVEGLEKLFGVPFGCFEQTTSITYPNILMLNYLRQTEQIKPETEMTAEEYISLGYQRLLSFEVQGGGFSWFGSPPANRVLTAYGLMEFNDMAQVYEIDERVIARTAQWLKDQQDKGGSWSPDEQYLHAESWSRIQKSDILPTAYICWALGEIGERGESVQKALAYLRRNLDAVDDSYVAALVANAFVAIEPKSETTMEVLKRLMSMAKTEDDVMYWESGVPSITFSRGIGADIEATGLATYALIKSGKYGDAVNKALTYLIRTKDARGTWYTTQGTIIVLRSLVASLGGVAEDIDARIIVAMNGERVNDIRIRKDNADVVQQLDLTEHLDSTNTIEITVQGEGNFMYEITRAYYIPWKDLPRPAQPPFVIDVDYDRTQLSVNDIVNVDVSIQLKRPGTAQMVMVDLGIPPGFEVQTPTLDELVDKKIQKYSITPRQLIIYLDEVSSLKPVELSYSLKAKYPIRAKVRSSRVYEYYNTSDEGVEQPIEMKVSL